MLYHEFIDRKNEWEEFKSHIIGILEMVNQEDDVSELMQYDLEELETAHTFLENFDDDINNLLEAIDLKGFDLEEMIVSIRKDLDKATEIVTDSDLLSAMRLAIGNMHAAMDHINEYGTEGHDPSDLVALVDLAERYKNMFVDVRKLSDAVVTNYKESIR